MSAQLFTYTPILGGTVFPHTVHPMPQKQHSAPAPSTSGLLLPSLNASVDHLVQRSSEPSAIRSHLRTFPGTRFVDELEENLRSYPIRQIHGKSRSKEEWLAVSKRIYAEIVLPWSPRILSLQDLYRYRWDTKRRLAVIYLLEEAVKRLHPLIHVPLMEMITIARLDYSARFGRLFRVNDLPVEILSNIFHYAVWSANDPDECNRGRLALGGVCRLWRRLVVGDPTLWNVCNSDGVSRSFEIQN